MADKKKKPTEKLREELLDRIRKFSPNEEWVLIRRKDRGAPEKAYLCIKDDGKVVYYKDEEVAKLLYNRCHDLKKQAQESMDWLTSQERFTQDDLLLYQ